MIKNIIVYVEKFEQKKDNQEINRDTLNAIAVHKIRSRHNTDRYTLTQSHRTQTIIKTTNQPNKHAIFSTIPNRKKKLMPAYQLNHRRRPRLITRRTNYDKKL